MKNKVRNRKLRLSLCVLSIVLSLLLLHMPAFLGQEKRWVGVDGLWSEASNWSPKGQPRGEDKVNISGHDNRQVFVEYENKSYTDAVLEHLQIDASSLIHSSTLILNRDRLAAKNEVTGISGSAIFFRKGAPTRSEETSISARKMAGMVGTSLEKVTFPLMVMNTLGLTALGSLFRRVGIIRFLCRRVGMGRLCSGGLLMAGEHMI